MEIVRIDLKNPELEDRAAVSRALAVLKRGGLVVYPTETAYALGCDATNASAVRNVFRLKTRDPKKPLPMIVGSRRNAARFAAFDPLSAALAKRFWPGPLTLVLPALSDAEGSASRAIARSAANRAGEIALRVSAHPTARGLVRALGRPIISTSANRSGGANPYRLAEALSAFGTEPDFCIDGGVLARRAPSTIVRCRKDACEVLREGTITDAALLRALRNC